MFWGGVGGGWGIRTSVDRLYPQQWQASCKSPVDACGFGGMDTAFDMFLRTRRLFEFSIFVDEQA